MNDIEILKTIKNMLLHAETQLLDYEALALEGLLNLYNKEKARNKDLEQIEKEHKEENGRLRNRINKTINKLNEDISDDNCMWVNNQEKIVTTTKTIIDRSTYAKEILELLEESEK